MGWTRNSLATIGIGIQVIDRPSIAQGPGYRAGQLCVPEFQILQPTFETIR